MILCPINHLIPNIEDNGFAFTAFSNFCSEAEAYIFVVAGFESTIIVHNRITQNTYYKGNESQVKSEDLTLHTALPTPLVSS